MKFTIEYHTRWGENLVLRSAGKSWPMSYVPDGKWSVELPAEEFFDGEAEREYFYEVVCDGLSTRHEWRLHSLKAAEKREEIHDSWSDSPGWKGAGTAIPVFALRSEDDFGVGEFLDLKKMVDWAVLTGQTFLQLLPVNDTTMFGTIDDSYPYNANSTFALHPQFINLPAAGVPVDKEYLKLQKQLNSFVKDGRPETDYVSVNREKRRLLRKAFDANWKSLSRTKAYRNFLAANREWLIPYSRFCALRDEFGTPDFSQWGEFAVYDEARLERWNKSHRSETDFNCFLQFHLDAQFRQVRDYAHSKGVVLKGDLPIGISRTSADAWQFPKLFNMDSQAGAPPDAFSADGQNWGFPTYNWEEMAKDGYAWWRRRFAHTGLYFDAYRIDHVLGFFRIWEIPYGHIYGLLGRFRPALPLTPEEIKGFGFTQNPAALTRPLLTEERLEELSDAAGGWGFKHYFHKNEDGLYELADEVKTQRGVCERVQDERLRTTLCDLIADVLFIEDPDTPGTYHPRIAGQQTDRYALLPKADREAFDRLHEHFFYHRHNAFWAQEAMKKLPAVIRYAESGAGNAASMLPCAEDLGMVPECVKDVLGQLDVLSLEIQRMPKTYGRRFADLSANPYLSVATIGTHDMPPLRLWWKTDADGRQAYWHEAMHREGEAPADLGAAECESIVATHLDSPSMLALIALQDYLAMDASLRHPQPEAEQINDPANPDQRWAYRMHLTIEQLAAATDFNEKLRALIEKSGR